MFGLMSKARHSREVAEYEKAITRLGDAITRLEDAVEELTKKLSYAVEGLSPIERQILDAKKEGNHIYDVFLSSGVRTAVQVPMNSKNYDKAAKLLAFKKFGYQTTNIRNAIKGCKATRRTL